MRGNYESCRDGLRILFSFWPQFGFRALLQGTDEYVQYQQKSCLQYYRKNSLGTSLNSRESKKEVATRKMSVLMIASFAENYLAGHIIICNRV